jgi:hypothetical protein
MYVDESGDSGLSQSPTQFFCLSGLVVHETRWLETLNEVVEFRRVLRTRYGIKLREEVHAGPMLNRPGDLRRIPKSLRLRLLRDTLDFQAGLNQISIVNVVLDKSQRPNGFDVFDFAWRALIQRFHNTIIHGNFPGPQNDHDGGLLFVDRTDAIKLRGLLRRMRRFNPVPSLISPHAYQVPVTTLVEDPTHRDSSHSYFTQLSDVNAYFLHQKERPNRYVRVKGGRRYFDRLTPALCTVAAINDPQGVVRL